MTDLEKLDNCIAGVKRLHEEIDILRTALTWAKARISPKMEETHKVIDAALQFSAGKDIRVWNGTEFVPINPDYGEAMPWLRAPDDKSA